MRSTQERNPSAPKSSPLPWPVDGEAALALRDHLIDVARARGATAAQMTVTSGDRTIVDLAVGWRVAGEPMRRSNLLRWHCATKLLTIMAFVRLTERRIVDPDGPIRDYLPQVTGAASNATLAGLVCHEIRWDIDPPVEALLPPPSWEKAVEIACRRRSVSQHFYSPWCGYTVLAAALASASGQRPMALLRDLAVSVGAESSWVGVPERNFGHLEAELAGSARNGIWDDHATRFDRLAAIEGSPANGGVGSASDLGKIVSAVSAELAQSTRLPDYKISATGDQPSLFPVRGKRLGSRCGPASVGQGGESGVAFADPDFGLSFAVLFNQSTEAPITYAHSAELSEHVYASSSIGGP